jgi:subtilisin family serine protease
MRKFNGWGAAVLVGALVAAMGLGSAASAATAAQAGKLTLTTQQQLDTARAQGQGQVTLLVAAQTGQASTAAAAIAAMGAQVAYREDTLDYLRVIAGTGSAQFTAAHPTWDGRGVTVGIVDSGVTLDHPSLLTTSTGERKIVDWVTGTAETGDNDPTWLNMSTQVSGAAPGAKLVSVRACLFVAGCTAHAMVEGMIYAVKQANVDVINMSIGGLPALNDGNNARAELYNRLIDRYNVQIFLSAGNDGPGLNTMGDPAVATRAVSVGAYVSKATQLANNGTVTAYDNNVQFYSSRGPREDGGLKPQFVAPGSAISTTPMWQPGSGLASELPPGYAMFNGTSMASPQAAGAAALLVSASRQARSQSQPAQLRQAMVSSAKLIADGTPDFSRVPMSWQGNGLLNTTGAWNLLKTNIKVADISASVPVTTVLSGFLATPGKGVGIYDREGVFAGSSYTRTYTLTRTSGGGTPITYNVSWVGDVGSFSSASTVSLPLNVPVQFPVTVNAATAGEHSAIMNLDNPGSAGIEFQTLNTVIAAERMTSANNFAVTSTSTIDRAQTRSHFFQVPADTPAFKVDFSGPSTAGGTGQARFLRWHPYGVGIDSNASSNCYMPAVPNTAGCSNGSTSSRSTAYPLAGVWEVTVDARRTSDADGAPYTLTASILGTSVSPNPDVIAAATLGVPIARSYTMTNSFSSFTGRAVGSTFGSAVRATRTISTGQQQSFLVQVAAGTTSLRATINNPSDPGADLDLYVFNCTSGTCVLAGQSADGDADESVTIGSPAAGVWAVLVDGFAVPSGTTTYSYVDVFVNPAFGSVAVTDANALRPAGASWTVPGSVTANQAPAAGRVLLGNVRVMTDTNITVGSGDVVVQSVTP